MFAFLLSFFVLVVVLCRIILKKNASNSKTVFVVVLGDVGRSPRMNYHSLSLAKHGFNVCLIGYTDSKQMEEIYENERIQIISLNSYPKSLQINRPAVLQYALKAIYLTFNLFLVMIKTRPIPKYVLVQNPPSIPTLGVVYLYTLITGSKFVIDWHNYGFTILALKSGPNNMLVRLCKKFEIFFGQRSDFNFCVTQAMKLDLANYGIKATTAYDKAHERFRPLNMNEKHAFYAKLIENYKLTGLKEKDSNENIFTRKDGSNNASFKSNRPILLVSSSSWTEDEDFHILIDAFEIYQNRVDSNVGSANQLASIVCILTGKGPLKSYYMRKFEEKNFKNIRVYFVWLEPNDYPKLLGSCDLGLCFHKSSSDLDLPMKVVDMFGAGLPALCLKFSCISELVKSNENGLLFSDENELANHFFNLFKNVNQNGDLDRFRLNLTEFSNWTAEWNEKIKPVFI